MHSLYSIPSKELEVAMKRIAKALFTLTLLVSFMIRIEGGRDVPTKGEAYAGTDTPRHTQGLLDWGFGGVLPLLGFGLGSLIPLLELPWLLRHLGYGAPRSGKGKKHDLVDDMKEYPPKGDTLVSQSP